MEWFVAPPRCWRRPGPQLPAASPSSRIGFHQALCSGFSPFGYPNRRARNAGHASKQPQPRIVGTRSRLDVDALAAVARSVRPCRYLSASTLAASFSYYANAYSIEPSFVCSQAVQVALCGADCLLGAILEEVWNGRKNHIKNAVAPKGPFRPCGRVWPRSANRGANWVIC